MARLNLVNSIQRDIDKINSILSELRMRSDAIGILTPKHKKLLKNADLELWNLEDVLENKQIREMW